MFIGLTDVSKYTYYVWYYLREAKAKRIGIVKILGVFSSKKLEPRELITGPGIVWSYFHKKIKTSWLPPPRGKGRG